MSGYVGRQGVLPPSTRAIARRMPRRLKALHAFSYVRTTNCFMCVLLLFCPEEEVGETDSTACLSFPCFICFLLWKGCRSTQLMPTTADEIEFSCSWPSWIIIYTIRTYR